MFSARYPRLSKPINLIGAASSRAMPEAAVDFAREQIKSLLSAPKNVSEPITKSLPDRSPFFVWGKSRLFNEDCFEWLARQPANSVHGVVTDPPYGIVEYTQVQQEKLRNGKGGVWRIPPSFDGHRRAPLPRFTTLDDEDLEDLADFFGRWAKALLPVLVPGAHVAIASNPLLSYIVSNSVATSGFERRGEVVRLVMTMRGGDRPKNAHEEFPDVSVMPRSMWEPWLLFRKPVEGRVQDNLRKWKTGGLRRVSNQQPFGDVIESAPTRKNERALAAHPSLKPQRFLRQIVRAMLPLSEGVILDTFAGSGSTLAACEAVGYKSVGVESDPVYFKIASSAIPALSRFAVEAKVRPCRCHRKEIGLFPDARDRHRTAGKASSA
jgi:DNA modification methylase